MSTYIQLLSEEMRHYEQLQTLQLHLNMARGKPGKEQLDLSNALLDALRSYHLKDGTDARNYGILEGIPECRSLFADLLELNPEHMILGGASSLNMMYDQLSSLCLYGTEGEKPWGFYQYEKTPIKWLCPCPGYDRHFRICEELGIEMIPVPLLQNGPDMELVKKLVSEDPLIKGIWCVPLYSNPEGVCYSDAVVDELASMKTAARDFRIFWDNAYGVHHFNDATPLKNILNACAKAGNPNRAYFFFSTSKITFPGAGISLISSSSANINEMKGHMSAQIIGHDKINQLRHVQFFKNPETIREHMKKHAQLLVPRFQIVLHGLEKEFPNHDFASWTTPKGGYFISLYTLPGCAKRVVSLAKEAGLTLTGAGAAYPYKKDPKDWHIRIAPSYPSTEELTQAMEILCTCIKIASYETMIQKEKENENGNI